MKTYEQLMKHYWGVIVPMAEDAGIKPWECVRICGTIFDMHPTFTVPSDKYTFALTVLEKRPVFVGDEVWLIHMNTSHIITSSENPGFIRDGCCTWTLPTKKRTFMLGDKELPCPIKTDEGFSVVIGSRVFYYDNAEDSHIVKKTIADLLKDAKNKE